MHLIFLSCTWSLDYENSCKINPEDLSVQNYPTASLLLGQALHSPLALSPPRLWGALLQSQTC